MTRFRGTVAATSGYPGHAALEAALDIVDRVPDASHGTRHLVEAALRLLLRRIWPYLDELDED